MKCATSESLNCSEQLGILGLDFYGRGLSSKPFVVAERTGSSIGILRGRVSNGRVSCLLGPRIVDTLLVSALPCMLSIVKQESNCSNTLNDPEIQEELFRRSPFPRIA